MTDDAELSASIARAITIRRSLDRLAIAAGVLWLASGFLPVIDEEMGFLTWLLAFLLPYFGIIVSIVNFHIIYGLFDAIVSVKTGYYSEVRYPLLTFPCIVVSLIWTIILMSEEGSSSSDPSIPDPKFNIGVYVYLASLVLSGTRIVLSIWHRRTIEDHITSAA